jgi:molybdate transport system permease protein
VLAFGRSLGEFGATITFVSSIPGETRTLASAIYALLQTPAGDSAVLRLCGVSVALSFGSLLLAETLARAEKRRLAR